jgi:hypothetical protein
MKLGRGRLFVIVGAIVACGVGAGTVLLQQGQSPRVHSDGAGPLASNGKPVAESMSVDPQRSGSSAWTFGVHLCNLHPEQPVELIGVSPRKSLGAGFRVLGVSVRTFVPSDTDSPIISVATYPPSSVFADPLSRITGYLVRAPCATGPSDQYTELLVGLAKVGDDGGGWQGINVDLQSRRPAIHAHP